MIVPFLTQAIFDDALFPRLADGSTAAPRLGLLSVLVGASVVITLVSAAIGVWQTYLTTALGNRVMRDLRERLFAHLQRMDLGFFTSTRTSEIQSRLGNDVAGVQTVVTDTASTILGNSVTVVSALVAMLVLSWRLTLVALLLMRVSSGCRCGSAGSGAASPGQTQGSMADMTAITQETLSVSGVLLAKVFDRQRAEVERYSAENARQADLQVRQTMTGQSFFALVQAFFGLTPSLVYLIAGLSIAGVFLASSASSLTAGTIVAFTTLQSRLLFPVVQLLRVGVEVQTSLALFERIFSYLDLTPAIVDRPGARAITRDEVAGRVGFEQVYFRYSGGDRADDDGQQPWTLADVSLDILPGQLVAFVGPSGAGKTTASYLVPRLYDVDGGRVLLDGHDVRDLTQSTLAGAVGVVTQESYLFHATVRDNLRYARPDATDATDAEIEAAAQAAHIHERIERLEDGYDTTIAIAHRLSTVLAADQINVFERGRVVERGTHAEPLAQGGLYAKLYDEQFDGGRVQARCDDGVIYTDGEVVLHAPPADHQRIGIAG